MLNMKKNILQVREKSTEKFEDLVGIVGKSAYEIALKNGLSPEISEEEWINNQVLHKEEFQQMQKQFDSTMEAWEDLGGIAISEEIPTNKRINAYINPNRGKLVTILTKEDIDQEVSSKTDKVPSSKAVKAVTNTLEGRIFSAEQKIEQGLDNEQIATKAASAIEEWFDAHPEATTTVQDASLTEDKFSGELKLQTLNNYITPGMIGAVCDGITDDNEKLQEAINKASAEGKYVRIDEDIAIANTVTLPDYSHLVIDRDVVVNIIADVDGFAIGSYVAIEGFGRIKVTINGYTHTCITFNAARYSTVKDISIYGYHHAHQDGIGIAILSTETGTCAYNRINKVNVCWLELGVLLRGETTEDGVTYKWNNNHDIDIHSSFCANAIHILSSHHHQIKVFGESAYQKKSKRTKYPCAYDTEIYLNNSRHNWIFNNLVDTGNIIEDKIDESTGKIIVTPDHNQNIIQFDKNSNFNSIDGIVFDYRVVDNSGRNYRERKREIKNMPIAGVNSILDDPGVTKTYEALETGAIVQQGLFQYPQTSTKQTFYYKNTDDAMKDAEAWETWGASLECNFNTENIVAPRYLNISAVPSQSPYKVGIVLDEDLTKEAIIPFGMFDNDVIDLSEYFGYDRLLHCRKIKFIFYGGYSFNKGAYSSIVVINSIALTHNESLYTSVIDEFSGIRRTGGSMTGELNVLAPTKDTNAVNKKYVDNLLSNDGTTAILFGKELIFNENGTVTWNKITQKEENT